jgi:CRISPR-associated protein Cst2
MSLHVFANIVTQFGTAANNRGDNQGTNITPLQKLIWLGEPHTTVSAEAIRFAVRLHLKAAGLPCNRHWAEHISEIPDTVREQLAKAFKGDIKVPCGYFVDPDFAWYTNPNAPGFADDDLLGFMSTEAAKEEAEGTGEELPQEPGSAEQESDDVADKSKKKKGKPKKKGTANVRRAVLEVTRAVSLTPWDGNVTFNAASPGATPSAQKKGSNPVPYGTELHATRYQYGIALTPDRLRDKSRAANAIDALCNLRKVAGNHGRFLFDFSPDAVVFRITQDPAPRLLYCFDTGDTSGKTVTATSLLKRITAGDVKQDELILGVGDLDSPLAEQFRGVGITPLGVKEACAQAVQRTNEILGIRG